MNLLHLSGLLTSRFPLRPQDAALENDCLAAVLVMLYTRRERMHILLIKRSNRLKSHAGEIAFPGGMREGSDDSLLQTALRETREELSLDVAEHRVYGQLVPVNTLTGFIVTPFVALLESPPVCQANPEEVAAVIDAPLAPLLASQQRETGYRPEEEMFEFFTGEHRVWGATARILHRLAQLLHPGAR